MPAPRITIAAATAVAMVAACPAAAHAGGRHHKPAKHFTAHGLLVSHTSSSLTLLATSVKSGKHTSANKAITVALPSRRSGSGKALIHRLATLHSGDKVTVTGTSSGGSFTAKNFSAAPAPFHVYFGSVLKVSGSLVTLFTAGGGSDDEGSFPHAITVDVSDAVVRVDGQPVQVQPGDLVAVLGSRVEGVVAATSVFGFSAGNLPDIAFGRVASVSGGAVSLRWGDGSGDNGGDGNDNGNDNGDGSGDNGDGSGGDNGGVDTPDAVRAAAATDGADGTGDGGFATNVTVGVSDATLVVNGNSAATVDDVQPGSRFIAFGTDNGDGTFTAVLAFDFTGHGCDSHHHGDGGRDGGDGWGHDSGGNSGGNSGGGSGGGD